MSSLLLFVDLLLLSAAAYKSFPLNEHSAEQLFSDENLFAIRKFDEISQNEEVEIVEEEQETMELAATHLFHPLFVSRVKGSKNQTLDRSDLSRQIFYTAKRK